MAGEGLLYLGDREAVATHSRLPLVEAASPGERVVVVIPTLNEELSIESCLVSLLDQIPVSATIVVADGGSTDGTCAVVERFAMSDPRILIVDNPRRLQSCAVNLVARMFAGEADVLVRADAHAVYPPRFLEFLLTAYRKTGAKSVVVPMKAIGQTAFQHAVAAAQNSYLGNGGAAHRRADTPSGFVDHGHHALFDLPFFLKLGGYDETFSHNEDFEFDYRLGLTGGKVWMCAEAVIEYVPRKTQAALARQYYRHGHGRGRTLTKHHLTPKLRQFLPLAMLIAASAGILLSPVFWPAILMPAGYLAICGLWGAWLACKSRDARLLLAGPAAVIMHMAWAVGVARSILTGWLVRARKARAAARAEAAAVQADAR